MNSVTLKMETERFSETLIHLTTAQCRNQEEGHNLVSNCREVLKTYIKITGRFALLFYHQAHEMNQPASYW
jgi:hypothetical protein